MRIYVENEKSMKFLDWDLLNKHNHFRIKSKDDADVIFEKDIHNPLNEYSRTIFFSHETPVEQKYSCNYNPYFREKFIKYYGLNINSENGELISPSPLFFWKPREFSGNKVEFNKKIGFFGRKGKGLEGYSKNTFSDRECTSLYPIRRDVVNNLLDHKDFFLFGEEWSSSISSPGRRGNDFRQDKIKTIQEENIGFILCFETAIMDGYFTEKFWDVLTSGSIPIYLGMPNAKDYLPSKSFIDGNLFYDKKSNQFKTNEMISYIKSFNESMYLRMQESGRDFLELSVQKKNENMNKLTNSLLNTLGSIE